MNQINSCRKTMFIVSEQLIELYCTIYHIAKNNQCEDCYDVNGGITVHTSDDSPKNEICSLMGIIEMYVANPSSIEGVEKIDLTKAHADGIQCGNDVAPPVIAGAQVTETVVDNRGSGVLSGILVPLVAAMILCALFLAHRRRQKHLRDMNEVEDRAALYLDEINADRDYPLNAIDVHQCNSLYCVSCNKGDATTFVGTEGSKMVRGDDLTWSIKNDETRKHDFPEDEDVGSLDSRGQQSI